MAEGDADGRASGKATGEGFDGTTVLVTGGTKGIGRGIATAFLDAGANVFVCSRNPPEAAVVGRNGTTATYIQADVRDAESVQALIAAGCPREAFSFYPTDHEGSSVILERCGRVLLFGDEAVTKAWSHDERVQIHGPGRSKVIVGPDVIDDWRAFLPVLASELRTVAAEEPSTAGA